MKTKTTIDGQTPEEFAAQWGCDGSGDRAPNVLGDGALFYNFGSERQGRTTEWLTGFLAAIDRTVASVKLRKDGDPQNATDIDQLTALKTYVTGLIPTGDRPDFYKLDSFTRGYITAALFTENDNSDPETGGDPFDQNYSHADIDTDTLKDMVDDCRQFQTDHAADLESYYGMVKVTDGTDAQSYAGHDFWLTRHHHGAGFWDRGLPDDLGERLTDAAQKFTEICLDVGDDGKIYA